MVSSVSEKVPCGVTSLLVENAQQMHSSVMQEVTKNQVFIGCAAVADYRPKDVSEIKIKKTSSIINLELTRNPDILLDVASLNHLRPYCVGFALETNDLQQNAKKKLKNKNLDMIVGNKLDGGSSPFDSNNNSVYIMDKNEDNLVLKGSKKIIASQIAALIIRKYSGIEAT